MSLEGTYNSASLLPRCTDHGDHFLLSDLVMFVLILFLSIQLI